MQAIENLFPILLMKHVTYFISYFHKVVEICLIQGLFLNQRLKGLNLGMLNHFYLGPAKRYR